VNNQVVALVLGGGQGQRLFPLTQHRSKPAVPIGGQYRLIDIPVSNCLHADIRRIFVMTQFNSASLNRHIGQTYRMDLFSQGFVEILAAEQTPDNTDWFQGTADAVRQAARHFARHDADTTSSLRAIISTGWTSAISSTRTSIARPTSPLLRSRSPSKKRQRWGSSGSTAAVTS
jgi:ADP-glucose pyrophosphorylase